MQKGSQLNLLVALEVEALRLRKVIEKTNDRRREELIQREYARLISRIEEIKNPPLIWLLRYE
ncbi:MAG: hypothetical protein GWO20_04205 [Candidatus Korarchaeota archaeon]|nr:hypothetical protein [Candidatus Korarchaeota archaeon]